jgi:protein-tyrosine phosphatase
MVTEIYWMATKTPGKIGVMPRPRGGEQLDAEVQSLHDADVGTLVSLLSESEVFELELHPEEEACIKYGIEFVNFPIRDRQTPAFDYATLSFLKNLANQLSQGRNIVTHCRMGIGRFALVAAAILVLSGLEPDDAFAAIRQARGCQVPDTEEQRQWVVKFARTHQNIQPTSNLWLSD